MRYGADNSTPSCYGSERRRAREQTPPKQRRRAHRRLLAPIYAGPASKHRSKESTSEQLGRAHRRISERQIYLKAHELRRARKQTPLLGINLGAAGRAHRRISARHISNSRRTSSAGPAIRHRSKESPSEQPVGLTVVSRRGIYLTQGARAPPGPQSDTAPRNHPRGSRSGSPSYLGAAYI
jgi:hypothetical protein